MKTVSNGSRLLGEFGRASHVDEHADQIALLADALRLRARRIGRDRLRHEQLEERKVGLGPQLAGEPDRRVGGADAVEHERLALRRLRQRAAVADHANPAGRAAGAAAADAGMRHLVAQARLEHAETLRHPHRPAVAIGQADACRRGARRAHARPWPATPARAGRDSRSGNYPRCASTRPVDLTCRPCPAKDSPPAIPGCRCRSTLRPP